MNDIVPPFIAEWRERQSDAFDLAQNSTARKTVQLDLWGKAVEVYANANLSIYSAQQCNARCPFCVEELRPASRGVALAEQKEVEADDVRYFAALDQVLLALRALRPSVSLTGGEPSKDPRLPRLLQTLQRHGARKRTVTSNGSGLFDRRDGRLVIDWIASSQVAHLNLSRAHWDDARNARLMRYRDSPDADTLQEVVRLTRAAGTRLRLSCVLVKDVVESLSDVLDYLEFAKSIGVDNVVFRQLMQADPATVSTNFVTRFSDFRRVDLRAILREIASHPEFAFQKQVLGYYYYVEVWCYRGIDVAFEGADLARIELHKKRMPAIVHELVFHPNGRLASTWQPWDGVIGPPNEWLRGS